MLNPDSVLLNGGAANDSLAIKRLNTNVMQLVQESLIGAYIDVDSTPNLTLTTTPQVITGWSPPIPPRNISESNGVFTFPIGGVYALTLERIYENDDANPALVVNILLEVQTDRQLGAGFETIISRDLPISAASGPNDPAIQTFTTPVTSPIQAGWQVRVRVSAEDNGSNPSNTRLIRSKIVAHRIYPLE